MAVNKMFVMLPVMLAARKLDGEDPNIVFLLRCIYGAVQTMAVLLVLFVYHKANAAAKDTKNDVIIYVPPPAQPFEDPNTKKTFSEKSLPSHLQTTCRGLLASTLFGICMTVGLHMWKGMIVGLAIQSVMAPFNLYENVLVRASLTGGLDGLHSKRIFGEKHREEITADDAVVDGEGNTIVLSKLGAAAKKSVGKKFEDVLLDTWDLGEEADIASFMKNITKENVNNVTEDNGWSPVMILSGLGAKGVDGALKTMKRLGANPQVVDKEGWNALHWAAFHGSAEAATIILSKDGYDGIALGLHKVADKEGKTPIDLARDEKNLDVEKVIRDAVDDAVSFDTQVKNGMRKRK